ncbi:MAG: tetratricopeptide repeat protein [Bryobacteraceae bacterium]
MARRERSHSQRESAAPAAKRPRPSWQIAAAIALAVFAVFARTVTFGFVRLDEDVSLYLNPHILQGLTPETILWAIRSTETGYWYPLTRLSQLLDVSMFGMNAGGHHFTNVVQHSATAAILFLVFERMTGDRWKSALAALLFALHPLRIESVAWVIERKDTLSGLFWALALAAYARYAAGRGSFGAVAAAFAAGLMSKPSVVTLPAILLLLDAWPLRRLDLGILRLLTEKIPLVAMSAVATAITIWTQHEGGATTYLQGVDTAARLANIPVAYALYLRDTVWPWRFSVLYPFENWTTLQLAGAAAMVAAISAIVLWRRHEAPFAAVGWFWFLIALLPNIGIVQAGLQSRADRFTYLGHMGLFVAVVWTLGALLGDRMRPAVLAWCGVLAMLTAIQTGVWKNTFTLFEHSLTVTPGATVLMTNLGLEYMDQGQLEKAHQWLTRAAASGPDVNTRTNVAAVLLRMEKPEEALAAADEAARRYPEADLPQVMRAAALLQLKRPQESVEAATRALAAARSDASRATHLHHRAMALHQLGKLEESEADLRRALALDETIHGARRDLANNLAIRKRYPEALTEYGLYLNKVPDDPIAQKAAAELREYLRSR